MKISRRAFDFLSKKEFYSRRNAGIFDLCKSVFEKRGTLDLVLLAAEAKRTGALAGLGGELYLTDLGTAYASSRHWREYAEGVKCCYLQRQQLRALSRYERDNDAVALVRRISELSSQILRLERGGLTSLTEFCQRAHQELVGESKLIALGYSGIDCASAPARGEILAVCGHTGVGKSIFALNILRNLLKAGRTVLVYTTEMRPTQYIKRLVALETRIPYNVIRYQQFDLQTASKLSGFLQEFSVRYEKTLFFSEHTSPGLNDIKAEAERVRPDVIVLDCLKGVRLLSGLPTKTERIEEFLNGLQAYIVQRDILLILVCHLLRPDRLRPHAEPTKYDIKDSASVENIADQVIILFTEKDEDKKVGLTKEILYKMDKDRNGIAAEGRLLLDRACLNIQEIDV